jgi:hypothetical protein
MRYGGAANAVISGCDRASASRHRCCARSLSNLDWLLVVGESWRDRLCDVASSVACGLVGVGVNLALGSCLAAAVRMGGRLGIFRGQQ